MIYTKPEQPVTAAEFRERFDHHLAAIKAGSGPLAIMDRGRVVGVFVAVEDFDQMYEAAVRDLLRERFRDRGPTVSHEEAVARIRAAIRRASERE
jgi:PHD/YefM family antitoxin component YafN of YafNO toxin-antitoxin module